MMVKLTKSLGTPLAIRTLISFLATGLTLLVGLSGLVIVALVVAQQF